MKNALLPPLPEVNTEDILEKNDSLETLKEGLIFLLNRYGEHQSKAIASKIVNQLEMMLNHYNNIDFPSDRCSFYRLIRCWRAKCI